MTINKDVKQATEVRKEEKLVNKAELAKYKEYILNVVDSNIDNKWAIIKTEMQELNRKNNVLSYLVYASAIISLTFGISVLLRGW